MTTRHTRLSQIAATTVPDQAGVPKLVLVGLDAFGQVWVKVGLEGEWGAVDQHMKTTPKSLATVVKEAESQ